MYLVLFWYILIFGVGVCWKLIISVNQVGMESGYYVEGPLPAADFILRVSLEGSGPGRVRSGGSGCQAEAA